MESTTQIFSSFLAYITVERIGKNWKSVKYGSADQKIIKIVHDSIEIKKYDSRSDKKVLNFKKKILSILTCLKLVLHVVSLRKPLWGGGVCVSLYVCRCVKKKSIVYLLRTFLT